MNDYSDAPAKDEGPDDGGREDRFASGKASFVFTERLVVVTRPDSVYAESFRGLRSNLLAQHIKPGRRALAICAPAEGSGCSFVAANLAIAMAQAGVNTLLIDANLREPSLDSYIVPSQAQGGLAACLRDDALPLVSAVAQVQSSLSVLYAGDASSQLYDHLGAPVFRTLIGQCLRDFDLTIVDTPPANQFADARRIASILRYALVVACRGRSYVKDVEVLLKELTADGAEPIGTYLNDY